MSYPQSKIKTWRTIVVLAFYFVAFCSFSFPPEKKHNAIIPFAELKQALSTDATFSPYFIDILPHLHQINHSDTVTFEITIPETWKNREVFIAFEGIGFDFGFSVNNQFIEYVKDTQNMAEWRLQRISKIGVNTLKFKALSTKNILHQAYIYSTPKLYISNYKVASKVDLSGANGELEILGEVRNLDKRDYYKYTIEFALYDAKGKMVFSEKSPAFSFGKSKNKTKGINYTRNLKNINVWSLSNPYLYTLIINMRDGDDDSELEILSKQIGFLSVEIIEDKLKLNGTKRPMNAAILSLDPSKQNKDTIQTLLKSLKKSNANLVFFNNYTPLLWQTLCLKNGILTLPDTNNLYDMYKNMPFKLVDIAWLDTSKTQLKITNYNLETDKENIQINWYLKLDNKKVEAGVFKLAILPNKETIWTLPEKVLEQKELKKHNLIIEVTSVNANFWHEKNYKLAVFTKDWAKD